MFNVSTHISLYTKQTVLDGFRLQHSAEKFHFDEPRLKEVGQFVEKLNGGWIWRKDGRRLISVANRLHVCAGIKRPFQEPSLMP